MPLHRRTASRPRVVIMLITTITSLIVAGTLLKLSAAPHLSRAISDSSSNQKRQWREPKTSAPAEFPAATCELFPLAKQRRGVAQWTPEIVTAYYANLTVDDTLAAQLRQYASRVEARRKSGDTKRLWDQYESISIALCQSSAPECSFFLRQDARLGAPSAFHFLYRKCCIEHNRLQVALSCAVQVLSRCKQLLWWAGFGTLLAVMREPGVVIPWDTDIDLFVEQSQPGLGCLHEELAVATRVPVGCTAKLVSADDDGTTTHAHGKKFALIYGSSPLVDERDSRVEVWIRDETKKSQRADIVFPLVPCEESLYGRHMRCPRKAHAALNASYGPRWCNYCKHTTSACKLPPPNQRSTVVD